MTELILTAAILAVAIGYWLVCKNDDGPSGPPPDSEQGWMEDEVWDSKQIVR